MTRELPAPKAVKDMFEELLGRSVSVSPGNPLKVVDIGQKLLVSVYVDDRKVMRAVVGMDVPLSVYAGAAIGLIPVAGTEEPIEKKELTSMLAENVTEVCNICSSLLNQEGEPRLKMDKAFMPGEMPPPDAIGYLLALGRRLDLNLEVQGYGSGRFAMCLAN
ncbi:hypothetical protein Val02_55750 [Virgisporangium aliadipatigenens]|uniref:Uncharacterized protein n=1 Tax=Virgisporangium aliadipatigenens TaxID=741659 RepID=A0A8J3YNA8_9ACTN|nr:hypothetical protein [Virgisporangium aliadipatigenens]GIJ48689.1 hypothetical protein Val02_55750 [Virgisporangium aliadipatigenens]